MDKKTRKELDSEIGALRNELSELTQDLILKVRDERLRNLLWSYSQDGEDPFSQGRERVLIDEIVNSTEPTATSQDIRPLPFGGHAIHPDKRRAPCPLCGGGREIFGTESPDIEGTYSLPVGLERHLEGWGTRMRQCSVMKAATNQARRKFEAKSEIDAKRELDAKMAAILRR